MRFIAPAFVGRRGKAVKGFRRRPLLPCAIASHPRTMRTWDRRKPSKHRLLPLRHGAPPLPRLVPRPQGLLLLLAGACRDRRAETRLGGVPSQPPEDASTAPATPRHVPADGRLSGWSSDFAVSGRRLGRAQALLRPEHFAFFSSLREGIGSQSGTPP